MKYKKLKQKTKNGLDLCLIIYPLSSFDQLSQSDRGWIICDIRDTATTSFKQNTEKLLNIPNSKTSPQVYW